MKKTNSHAESAVVGQIRIRRTMQLRAERQLSIGATHSGWCDRCPERERAVQCCQCRVTWIGKDRHAADARDRSVRHSVAPVPR
ncbi:hypothetical protein N8I71_09015 [Roseibacterium sp. SDUM158016]|uniref:hypothetical protein n=1 Tax=Roseicyclus sediminis TaxID=2980997 RepID=UPI0021D0BC68|nr:hypothetical protein [Roseibacterium sp. SDUM158016]MCU4652970.1 hypothetical protein [Roseibacterium sp. SDUM158016]